MKKQKLITRPVSFIFAVVVLTIESIYDFQCLSIGDFITTVLNFLWFVAVLDYFEIEKINKKLILDSLFYGSSICLLLVMVVAAKNGMSLLSYASSEENYVRIGYDTVDLISAMAIPTYSGIVLSCSYVSYVCYANGFWKKITYLLMSIYSVLLGFLSVSRGFILCLGVLVLLIIANTLMGKEKKRSAMLVLVVLACMVVFYTSNADIIDNMIVKMISRMNGENVSSNDSRMDIWLECFKYQGANPEALFFGKGLNNYILIGRRMNLHFGMSAHNLLIDTIMSWGWVGFSLFLASIFNFYRRLSLSKVKPQLIFTIPFVVWFSLRMIGGAFTVFSMYVMLIAFIVVLIPQDE